MKPSHLPACRDARRAAVLFFLNVLGALAQSYSITLLTPDLQFESIATGLNEQSQVVGEYQESSGHWHAFVLNSQFTDIGTLGGPNSQSFGINVSGDVVGASDTASGAVQHAFLYRSGQLYDLNSLVGPPSGWVLMAARSINDSGQIIGDGLNGGQKETFLLSPIGSESCSPPEQPVCFTVATWRGASAVSGLVLSASAGPVVISTNAQAQSVGSKSEGGETRAVLLQNGAVTDLNSLIRADSGWTLLNAVAINDFGQIAGNGLFQGRTQAYLLTPLQPQVAGAQKSLTGPALTAAIGAADANSTSSSLLVPLQSQSSNLTNSTTSASIVVNRSATVSSSNSGMLSADGASPSTTVDWLTVTPTGNPVNFFGTQSGTLANPGDPNLNDFVTMLGWNANGGGGVANQSYAGLFDAWENHWCPAIGQDCFMERHIEFYTPSNMTQYRPLTIAMDTSVAGVILSGLQFSNLNFNSADTNAQRRDIIIPGASAIAKDIYVGPWQMQFNTNGKAGGVIQQNNSTSTAYVGMLWTDTNNVVNIGDSNAAGIYFGAPLLGMTFANNDGLQWKDAGGTPRQLLSFDTSNNIDLGVGSSSVENTQAFTSAGHQWRFLNNNGTIRILTLDEPTHNAIFSDTGTNTNYRVEIGKSGTVGTLHVQDETASTGFTRVKIDPGAADTVNTTIVTIGAQAAIAGGILHIPVLTSTLPNCSIGINGLQRVVADALTPTYLGTLVGGGTVVSPVLCNGTNWVTY